MHGVGPSASASRSSLKSGEEVFDNRISIRQVDDGTFMITAGMRKVPPKSNKEPYLLYCPDKELTADTLEEAFTKAKSFFDGGDPT